jgi:S1-C subfamily serine protease
MMHMTRRDWRELAQILLVALLLGGLISMLGGCAAVTVTTHAAPRLDAPVDTSHVVTTMGRFVGGCHACPTDAGEALTAAHCVDVAPLDNTVAFYPLEGESPAGWRGMLVPAGAKRISDLAILQPEPAFETWYSRGPKPARGDAVTLVGFDKGRKDPLGRKVDKGVVTSVAAGHFTTSAFAGPGSSGGCVLDAQSRVIGIVSAGMRFDEGQYATVAVGVWE